MSACTKKTIRGFNLLWVLAQIFRIFKLLIFIQFVLLAFAVLSKFQASKAKSDK